MLARAQCWNWDRFFAPYWNWDPYWHRLSKIDLVPIWRQISIEDATKVNMWIILVGFLPDDHGRSCKVHPYGCGNALIEGEGNGVGRLVCLLLVEKVHLA